MANDTQNQAQNNRKSALRNALVEMLRSQPGAPRQSDSDQFPSFDSPMFGPEFAKKQAEAERQKNEALRSKLFQQQAQERLVFTQRERKARQEIEYIRKELLGEVGKLNKATQSLAKEIELTVSAQTPEPGVYHFNFLGWIREQIADLFKKTNDSLTWLSAFNSGKNRKAHFGKQVKQSGTKFLLSQERTVQTQMG